MRRTFARVKQLVCCVSRQGTQGVWASNRFFTQVGSCHGSMVVAAVASLRDDMPAMETTRRVLSAALSTGTRLIAPTHASNFLDIISHVSCNYSDSGGVGSIGSVMPAQMRETVRNLPLCSLKELFAALLEEARS